MDKKVLIIDDEEQDRRAMTIVLEKAGYNKILCADTGERGIEAVKSFKPDIVVIDVVLRNIDGFDVCRQIKAMEGVKPKIIMITGHLEAVIAQKARVSGADELIEKIPGFRNIGRTIDNIIRN